MRYSFLSYINGWYDDAEQLGIAELLVIGFIMGAASGFFWTNRYLITLNSTNDDNRNYFLA